MIGRFTSMLLLCSLLILSTSAQTLPPAAFTAVTIDSAVVNQQLTLNWAVDSGGGAIDSFTIFCHGANDCPADMTNLAPSTTSHSFTGLTNGYPYSFVVVAFNSIGNSTSALSNEATPSCGSGVLEFTASAVSIVESQVVTLTITRLGGSSGFVQVRVDSLTPGQAYGNGVSKISQTSAIANFDYSPIINNQLIFASGQTQQVLEFSTLNDQLYEKDEIVEIHLSAPSGGLGACRAVVGLLSPVQVTIVDDGDSSIQFTAIEFIGEEGELIQVNATLESATDLTGPAYNISEMGIMYQRVGLSSSDAGGNAIYDVDFRADSTYGELTFHGAHTSAKWMEENKTFSVETRQDGLGESDESIILQLYDPVCYCSMERVSEKVDDTLLVGSVHSYALNNTFWMLNETSAKVMRM